MRTTLKLATTLALLLCAGCQSIRVTDPATGIVYESKTFLMSQGPKQVTVKDGNREVIVSTGPKDQTAVLGVAVDALASRVR